MMEKMTAETFTYKYIGLGNAIRKLQEEEAHLEDAEHFDAILLAANKAARAIQSYDRIEGAGERIEIAKQIKTLCLEELRKLIDNLSLEKEKLDKIFNILNKQIIK